MIGKKKKLSKKEIQEDKLVTSFYKTQGFFEKNQQNLLIGIGAIAVIVLAIFWYNSKVEDDNIQATTQLASVIPLYEQGQYQKAIDGEPGTNVTGLLSIVENFGNTSQGEIAKMYLANCYFSLGNYEKANEYYSDYSGDNDLYKASSLAGQAACNEMKGNFEDAADDYKKAANVVKMESQAASYLLSAGKNYLKANAADKAKELFEQITNDYKNTNAAREIERFSYNF
ncbi:MAG: tetratricopeptide repeat protein [Ignavibacteriae bacterium]|nr:tetratricopeptide repeat protein [Ignavibacteriota bacterium]